MARQVVSLGVRPFGDGTGEWLGAVRLAPALVDGGAEAWLVEIDRIADNIRLRLDASASGDGTAVGPEFTATFETAAAAFVFAEAGGASVTLPGPGHASNAFADPAEPYFWTPPGSLWPDWVNGSGSGEVTLTLDDGVRGAVHAVAGAAAAGAAFAAATVERVPALTLADFDAGGLELDALALIRAGAGAGGTLYATPPRGTVGTLVDGELGLGAGEAAITRIRRRNGDMLLVNDNDALSLGDYFGSGGAGADLTLSLRTQDGAASLPVSSQGNAGTNFIQFGTLDAGFQALLDGIADGDLFIFALARPAPVAIAVRGTAAAGPAETAATVARIAPPVRPVAGTAQAGAAETAATLARIAALAVHGRAEAGGAQARARLVRVGHLPVRGLAASGAPQVSARVRRMPPPGDQYARTIRESAPERRLLTALEIRHPAVAAPVRVVNDTEDRTIEGNRYVALRFDARLADDVEGQAPQAELAIDNVGRALTQWVEAAQGGTGATVRVLQVLDIDDPPIEWELTMDLAGVQVDAERVTARLGFDPLLGRAAVTLRHDPQTSPGLF